MLFLFNKHKIRHIGSTSDIKIAFQNIHPGKLWADFLSNSFRFPGLNRITKNYTFYVDTINIKNIINSEDTSNFKSYTHKMQNDLQSIQGLRVKLYEGLLKSERIKKKDWQLKYMRMRLDYDGK